MFIIETNYKMKENSFQSRIIKFHSWDVYCSLYSDYKGIHSSSINGTMFGPSLSNNMRINNLVFDDASLSCDFILYNGSLVKRFAQKVFSLDMLV